MAGANKSCRFTHHKICPLVRAAIPAANKAAAAPSTAPLPPPATSCNAPIARPPPGRCWSIAASPNGKTAATGLAPASSRRIFSRKTSITAGGSTTKPFNKARYVLASQERPHRPSWGLTYGKQGQGALPPRRGVPGPPPKAEPLKGGRRAEGARPARRGQTPLALPTITQTHDSWYGRSRLAPGHRGFPPLRPGGVRRRSLGCAVCGGFWPSPPARVR